MRTEEELAIWALVEVLALSALMVYFLSIYVSLGLSTSVFNQLLLVVLLVAFLPVVALALSIRHFRKERKEKEP